MNNTTQLNLNRPSGSATVKIYNFYQAALQKISNHLLDQLHTFSKKSVSQTNLFEQSKVRTILDALNEQVNNLSTEDNLTKLSKADDLLGALIEYLQALPISAAVQEAVLIAEYIKSITLLKTAHQWHANIYSHYSVIITFKKSLIESTKNFQTKLLSLCAEQALSGCTLKDYPSNFF